VKPDLATFEASRASLLGHAYRMLGDFARAEEIVQDAWLRWQKSKEDATAPHAYLVTVVTRLCLNELNSGRRRHEEPRGDRLPEPIATRDGGLGRVELLDRISMAFLVALQRLTPTERAVLLLHDVFDFEHAEVARLIGKTVPACRQLLKRAKENVTSARRTIDTPPEEHRRLLRAFMRAADAGEAAEIVSMLAEDAALVIDGGDADTRFGRTKNLRVPIVGAARIAAFLAATVPRAPNVERLEIDLNDEPAILAVQEGRPRAATLIAVSDGKIQSVFIQADPARLRHARR